MCRQYPINDFYEYTAAPNGDTEVTKIDLTDPAIPLVDINDVYKNVDDEYPMSYIRRGKYLIFTEST